IPLVMGGVWTDLYNLSSFGHIQLYANNTYKVEYLRLGLQCYLLNKPEESVTKELTIIINYPETNQNACIDYDGGNNIYTKGFTFKPGEGTLTYTKGMYFDDTPQGRTWHDACNVKVGDTFNSVSSDKCLAGNDCYVLEFSCNGDSNRYQCPNGCQDGACIQNIQTNETVIITNQTYCYDSDNGMDWYTKGGIKTSEGVLEDYCLTGNKLAEATCNIRDGNYGLVYYDCKSCVDGRCDEAVPITETYTIILQGSTVGGVTVVDVDEAETKCIVEYAGKTYILDKGVSKQLENGIILTAINVKAVHETGAGQDWCEIKFGGSKIPTQQCNGIPYLDDTNPCITKVFTEYGFTTKEDQRWQACINEVSVYNECPEHQLFYMLMKCMINNYPELDKPISSCLNNVIQPPTQQCNGCLIDNKCMTYGVRSGKQFCDMSGQLVMQKADNSYCKNNYECSSNICINNKCVNISLWNRFVQYFSRWFSR
ncbi:MAG: hypothetical protein KKD48_04220, partial [Nanoarchaeota archaeon]|nr:hypothetical protein [Nanoarchaeota archaeon]